jgi:hypothetical protein
MLSSNNVVVMLLMTLYVWMVPHSIREQQARSSRSAPRNIPGLVALPKEMKLVLLARHNIRHCRPVRLRRSTRFGWSALSGLEATHE